MNYELRLKQLKRELADKFNRGEITAEQYERRLDVIQEQYEDAINREIDSMLEK